MSIINCKHCGQTVDIDFNAEHEDECEENPTNQCTLCEGEGMIPCDEYDKDSHCYMPGVGEQPCECQAV